MSSVVKRDEGGWIWIAMKNLGLANRRQSWCPCMAGSRGMGDAWSALWSAAGDEGQVECKAIRRRELDELLWLGEVDYNALLLRLIAVYENTTPSETIERKVAFVDGARERIEAWTK